MPNLGSLRQLQAKAEQNQKWHPTKNPLSKSFVINKISFELEQKVFKYQRLIENETKDFVIKLQMSHNILIDDLQRFSILNNSKYVYAEVFVFLYSKKIPSRNQCSFPNSNLYIKVMNRTVCIEI